MAFAASTSTASEYVVVSVVLIGSASRPHRTIQFGIILYGERQRGTLRCRLPQYSLDLSRGSDNLRALDLE